MTDKDYRAMACIALGKTPWSEKTQKIAIETIARSFKRYHDYPNTSHLSKVLCCDPEDVLQYVGILQNVGSYTQVAIKYRLEQGV